MNETSAWSFLHQKLCSNLIWESLAKPRHRTGTCQEDLAFLIGRFYLLQKILSDAESPSPTPPPMPFQAKQDHT